jgi:CheY-like chemotaxis protein
MNDKPNILYADDQECFHILMQSVLGEYVNLDFAHNGQEAYEKAMIKKYDIILMDIGMPILSGDQSAEKIKKIIHDQYIIAMTAFDITEFNSAPFDEYYQKPIKFLTLKDKLFKIYNGE